MFLLQYPLVSLNTDLYSILCGLKLIEDARVHSMFSFFPFFYQYLQFSFCVIEHNFICKIFLQHSFTFCLHLVSTGSHDSKLKSHACYLYSDLGDYVSNRIIFLQITDITVLK